MTMERSERDMTTADLAGRGEEPDASTPDRGAEEGREEREGRADEPLLPSDASESYMTRWKSIQASFVDEPRSSLQEADSLVAEAMQRLAEGFAEERDKLEAQWDRGDDVSTEELRVTLQRYRSFFERLLAA